jgi:hypothetical protein
MGRGEAAGGNSVATNLLAIALGQPSGAIPLLHDKTSFLFGILIQLSVAVIRRPDES